MDSGAMTLPPGFELESSSTPVSSPQTPANLPPGFELEQPGQKPSNDYWSDVRRNASQGLREIPQGVLSAADTGIRAASLTSPVEIGKSIFQTARGTPPAQTDISQDFQSTVQGAKAMGQGLFQTAKDVGSSAIFPAQVAAGTPPQETYAGQSFRERPLGFTANIAGAAAAGSNLFKGNFAKANAPLQLASPEESAASSFLRTKGAQGINSTVGLRAGTIEDLTRSGQNPGIVGADVLKTLSDEGVVGRTYTDTFQRATKKANLYGQQVGQAFDAIKNANQSLGVYPEMEDSLKVEANPILKPIIDEANSLRDSGYPADKVTARGLRAMYNNLSKKATANSGETGTDWLTLDDIHDELGKIGDQIGRTGPNDMPIVKRLYGRLADVRDDMINDIASRVGDPKLASNLLQANANYSRYMRILPDIKSAAASEPVGQMKLGSLFQGLRDAIINGPQAGRMMMKAGGETVTPEIARDLIKQAKGDRNLARQMAQKKGLKF